MKLKRIANIDITLKDIFCFYLLLLLSGTAFINIFSRLEFLCIIPIILCFGTLVQDLRNHIALSYFLLFLMIIFAMIVNLGDGSFFYVLLVLKVTAAYIVSRRIPLKQIVILFYKTIVFLSVVSLIGYVLINCTDLGSYFPKMASSNGTLYGTVGLFNYILDIPDRNCGFFWEPGIFASMIIIALCCWSFTSKENLSLRGKKYRYYNLIMILALITTKSSAGYALILLYFLFTLALNMKKTKIGKTIFIWIVFIILIGGIVNLEGILTILGLENNYYLGRIAIPTIMESQRYYTIIEGLEAFVQSPIKGLGIISYNDFTQGRTDTSTIINMLLIFGVWGIQYPIYLVLGVLRRNFGVLPKIVLCLIILSIVNKEPHTNILITWLFLFAMLGNVQRNRAFDKKCIEG